MKIILLLRRVNPSVVMTIHGTDGFTRRTILLSLLWLLILAGLSAYPQGHQVKVMTFNIRFDNPADGINSWENRRDLVTRELQDISPDFIGMQEVLERQAIYLKTNLKGYDYVGVGRDNGKTGGEYVPIFYRNDRYHLEDWGTFWLSPTPSDTGSVGWDAALTRICTWGKFIDNRDATEFFFLNTHFDHMGDTARAESAKLILDFINKKTSGYSVILTGDFNCSPAEEPYRVLTESGTGLTDACKAAGTSEDFNLGTFNGFGSEKESQRIDLICFSGNWKAESYKVLQIKDGEVLISDHWPVLVRLRLLD